MESHNYTFWRDRTTKGRNAAAPVLEENVDRGFQEGHSRIVRDYFAEDPVYGDTLFRRRFRMRRPLFLRLVHAVEAHGEYFQQRPDATGKLGLFALQKFIAAIRQLTYGMPADAVDEYVRTGESTTVKSLKRFCRATNELFGD
ncbi:hypothetical protein PsorP6_003069 [Peronosclerospora sorghi]|uniref:Uncharacterized protein n=1 Tax=Peronosclerospora sorghi TaxID=230839 RepID=A0ACC0VQ88_9STRA|nr:hypothetical protein PsorP6_003069 [Peronosclerospora sorghi]